MPNKAEVSVTADNSTKEFDKVDWEQFEASMMIDYSYVIVPSTKNYNEGLFVLKMLLRSSGMVWT